MAALCCGRSVEEIEGGLLTPAQVWKIVEFNDLVKPDFGEINTEEYWATRVALVSQKTMELLKHEKFTF